MALAAQVTQSRFPDEKIQRLAQAVESDRAVLRRARRNRRKTITQYVGFRYSSKGTADKHPLGLMELAVSAYTLFLVGGKPAARINTRNKNLRAPGRAFEYSLNGLAKEIDLRATLRRAVIDAMFGLAVVKTGLQASEVVEVGGILHDPGQAFADVVSLDNWVHDTSATRWESVQYCGDIYRTTLREMHESGLYDPEVLNKLKATEPSTMNEDGEIKVSSMGDDEFGGAEAYEETIDLIDLWLPRDNLVLTFPWDKEVLTDNGPLRQVQWVGPERGMYNQMMLSPVPDKLLPLAPMAMLQDLDSTANRIFNKLVRQAERQKTILSVARGADSDGRRIVDASDGETIGVDNPRNAQEFSFGGADPSNFAFLLQTKDIYSWMAGNLDTILGLSPQTETVGQERLLNQNSSRKLMAMKEEVNNFTERIFRDLGFFIWHDPVREFPVVKQARGGVEVETTFRPRDREGDLYEHEIDIEPYSMMHEPPELKLQKLSYFVNQVLPPLAPHMAQQGLTLDARAIIDENLRLLGLENFGHLILDLTQIEMEKAMGELSQAGGGKPAVTERNYTRRSIPGSSRSGKDDVLSRLLMGGGAQNSEVAAMGRPTG